MQSAEHQLLMSVAVVSTLIQWSSSLIYNGSSFKGDLSREKGRRKYWSQIICRIKTTGLWQNWCRDLLECYLWCDFWTLNNSTLNSTRKSKQKILEYVLILEILSELFINSEEIRVGSEFWSRHHLLDWKSPRSGKSLSANRQVFRPKRNSPHILEWTAFAS